jgi:hypothetical protein
MQVGTTVPTFLFITDDKVVSFYQFFFMIQALMCFFARDNLLRPTFTDVVNFGNCYILDVINH